MFGRKKDRSEWEPDVIFEEFAAVDRETGEVTQLQLQTDGVAVRFSTAIGPIMFSFERDEDQPDRFVLYVHTPCDNPECEEPMHARPLHEIGHQFNSDGSPIENPEPVVTHTPMEAARVLARLAQRFDREFNDDLARALS